MTGAIFDIQRFALHDGPGIRTTVFFKGCPNRCGWCHNPESFVPRVQLQYYPTRCTLCMRCAQSCPVGAHRFIGDSHMPGFAADAKHSLDRSKCKLCGACAADCYSNALVMTGRQASVGDVMREVMEDAAYYETSGGGVTLSGGEPVIQADFMLALLKALKAENIHTNLQTAGNYSFSLLEQQLPFLDMVMYDIKGISEEIYVRHIRGDRRLMLDNLRKLDGAFNGPIVVRTPVIFGVNAAETEIVATARYIEHLKHLESYRLIPYHALGRVKYDALGEPRESENASQVPVTEASASQVPITEAQVDMYSTPDAAVMASLEKAAARYVPVYNLKNGYTKRGGLNVNLE